MIEVKLSNFYCSALLLLLTINATVFGEYLGECNVTILTDQYRVSTKDHPYPTAKNNSCTPHVLFHQYCNTCICHAEGNAFTCTIDYCIPGHFTEDGIAIPESERKPCKPYDHYMDDCNDCFCKKSGFGGLCTNRDCTKLQRYQYTVLKQLE